MLPFIFRHMAKFQHRLYTSFTLSANIDGKLNLVEFREGGNPPFFSHATLTTEDEKLIDYIREMEEFGTQIIEVEEPKEENQAPGPDATVYEEVTTVQAAKDILVTNYGIGVSKIQNKKSILYVAEGLNIKFPNLPE